MQRLLFISAAVAGLLSTGTAASAADRLLVYNFTFGVQNQTTEAASANGSAAAGGDSFTHANTNGANQYTGKASDRGQISVDIKGLEADGGLVADVSEKAQNGRNAAAVTCVVYPSTNVVCAQGLVNPEEFAVLRTLSPKFVDPSQFDANRHWRIENKDAGVKIDFTATPGATGLLQIASDRNETITGQNRGTIVTNAKYTYDMAKVVSNTISEYATYRQQNGPGTFSTTVVDITAQLASDSKT